MDLRGSGLDLDPEVEKDAVGTSTSTAGPTAYDADTGTDFGLLESSTKGLGAGLWRGVAPGRDGERRPAEDEDELDEDGKGGDAETDVGHAP